MINNFLDLDGQIVLRNISRIEKSPKGCFHCSELKRRFEIKKNKIDIDKIIKTLIESGLIMAGNKKDIYCLTHQGKLQEHELEKEYNKDTYGYSIIRNRYS